LLPFASAVAPNAPVVAPPPPSKPAPSNQAEAKPAVRHVIDANDKSKIGRLYGSINRIKNTPQQAQENKVEKRNTPYTETQFEEVWFRFKQSIIAYPDLHFLFNKAPVKQENTIQLKVDNMVVLGKLNSIKDQLLAYLGNQLNNDNFELSIQLTEQKNKPTTPREKARAMNESNGNLAKLFVSWGLQL
jgi:hypothetical protein